MEDGDLTRQLEENTVALRLKEAETAAQADRLEVLREATEERARFDREGFAIHVKIDRGVTIQLGAELSFTEAHAAVSTHAIGRYSESFIFCCKQLPSEEAMETEEDEFVDMADDEQFAAMKRKYMDASVTAFPIVVIDAIVDDRTAVKASLRAIDQLVSESIRIKDVRRALDMCRNVQELLSRKAWDLSELAERTVLISGNDPTENAHTILRSAHGKTPYEEGLEEAFMIQPEEAKTLMESWVPLSSNVSSIRKEDGGLKNNPLARGSVDLLEHWAMQSITAKQIGSPPVIVAAFGKLADLMVQLKLDPMRLATCFVNPAGAYPEAWFKEGPVRERKGWIASWCRGQCAGQESAKKGLCLFPNKKGGAR